MGRLQQSVRKHEQEFLFEAEAGLPGDKSERSEDLRSHQAKPLNQGNGRHIEYFS